MIHRDIDVGSATTVEISAEGDLTIVGGDVETLTLQSDTDEAESISVEPSDETLRLRLAEDARVQVPRRLHLRLSHVAGDVRASGLGAGIEVQTADGDVRLQNVQGDVLVATAAGDADVRSVQGAVRCGTIAGDLRATEIAGDLAAESVAGDVHGERIAGQVALAGQVAGDLVLATLGGAAAIGAVAGDLSIVGCPTVGVQSTGGDLRLEDVREQAVVDQVGGDATLDHCRGPVGLEHVGGDLRGRGLAGGLQAPNVGGDVRLNTMFAPGREYVVSCGGSASIILAGNHGLASATFELRSGEGGLHVDLPLQDVVRDQSSLRGRLGNGEATVRIQAGRRVRLASREGEAGFEGMFGDLFTGFDLFGGIEAGMNEAFGRSEGGRQRFEQGMRDVNERIQRATDEIQRRTGERLERQAQHMARRAEELAQRAAARAAEQVAKHAERGWGWRGNQPGWAGAWSRRSPGPPPPPAAPSPPPKPRASEEERLTVLRMLAEGKINADQAARLLEALGG